MLVILHLVLSCIALSFEIPKEKAFEFEVSCDAQTSKNDCNSATETIKNVGVLIAEILKIVVPIKAHVAFKKMDDKCGINLKTGIQTCLTTYSNSTGSYLVARKNHGPLFRFPQAAIKQSTKLVNAAAYDMVLEFNSNINWNLGTTTNQQQGEKHDLALYAAREITKGLGFQSNYQLHLAAYPQPPYMTPRIIVGNDKSNPNRKLTWFDHLNAFDSMLYYLNNYLFKEASELLGFPPQVDTSVDSFKAMIVEIPKMFKSVKALYHKATMERFDFKTTKGAQLSKAGLIARMQTGTVSLVLVDPFANSLADFMVLGIDLYKSDLLMANGTTGQGKTLQAILEKNPLYGARTLEILKQIGYVTYYMPQIQAFELAGPEEQIPSRVSISHIPQAKKYPRRKATSPDSNLSSEPKIPKEIFSPSPNLNENDVQLAKYLLSVKNSNGTWNDETPSTAEDTSGNKRPRLS